MDHTRVPRIAGVSLIASLLLLPCASCVVSDEAPGDGTEALLVGPLASGATPAAGQSLTAPDVETLLSTRPAEQDRIEREPDVLRAALLDDVARHVASRVGRLPANAAPIGTKYLRDLRGRATAYAATFVMPQSSASEGSTARIAARLNDSNRAFAAAYGEHRDNDAFSALRGLRATDAYYTVIVGATPLGRRIISASPGLPPQVFGTVGRNVVAAQLGDAPDTLVEERAFYDPKMTRGLDMGIVYRRSNGARVAYTLPGAVHVMGTAVPEQSYLEVSDARVFSTQVASTYASRWGALGGKLGRTSAASMCTACSAQVQVSVAQGISGVVSAGNPACTCQYHYDDGTTAPAASCDDITDVCCQWVGGEYQDVGRCLNDCTCDCSTSYTTDYGKFIEGVPTFFQHIPGNAPCATGPRPYAVGCGPIAGAQLLAWYDSMGYSRLGEPFRAGPVSKEDQCTDAAERAYDDCIALQGKTAILECLAVKDQAFDDCMDVAQAIPASTRLQWEGMAEMLYGPSYMNATTWCLAVNGPALQPTSVAGHKWRDAIEKYISEHGHSANVVYERYDSNGSYAALAKVKHEIDALRPVMIEYCTGGGPNCEGIGLTDTALSDWVRSHQGLITGYYNDDLDLVYVDKGWALGGNEVIEWDFGNGDVRLVSVEMTSPADKTAAYCGADSLASYYTPTFDDGQNISYSSREHTYPVVSQILGPKWANCNVLGGTELVQGGYTTQAQCLTPKEMDKLEETYEDVMSQINNMNMPDWENAIPSDDPPRP